MNDLIFSNILNQCVYIYIYIYIDAVIWRWDLFFACEQGVGRVGPLLQVFAILFRIIHHASEAAKVCCPLGLRANASIRLIAFLLKLDKQWCLWIHEITWMYLQWSKLFQAKEFVDALHSGLRAGLFGKGGCHEKPPQAGIRRSDLESLLESRWPIFELPGDLVPSC